MPRQSCGGPQSGARKKEKEKKNKKKRRRRSRLAPPQSIQVISS